MIAATRECKYAVQLEDYACLLQHEYLSQNGRGKGTYISCRPAIL